MSEPVKITHPVRLDDLITAIRTVHDEPLDQLQDAVLTAEALGDIADHLIGHFVDQARRSGASWTEIGKCMGVTKQAAQKRFVPRTPVDTAGLDPNAGFSRFTERARNVIVQAQNRAHAARNPEILPLHLVLGLFADPTGLAANWAKGMTLTGVESMSNGGLDRLQGALDVAGMAAQGPLEVAGPFIDLTNAAISAGRGNWGDAGLSALSAVPFVGAIGNAAKIGKHVGAKGAKPANMSPHGAGRSGAFNEAKRQSGIPTSQQPSRVLPNTDLRGNPQPGRVYEYEVPASGGGTQTVRIRDDAGGHNFGPGNSQNRGSHFNDAAGNHYDY